MTSSWTLSDIPSLAGKRAFITGANSGIGFAAAVELARKGATVLLACRSRARGEEALVRLRTLAAGPGSAAASAELVLLDLASLDSVREVVANQLSHNLPIDLLINNAGVMAPPKRLVSPDGFELQFATNVLGHFALTLGLLPLLGTGSRVVNVASIAHKRGHIAFDDLQSERKYSPMGSYSQSKLANLLFTFELERRLRTAGAAPISLAVHPGVARTNLFVTGDFPAAELAVRRMMAHVIGALLNSELQGALPTLYAATSPDAQPVGYYGPQGLLEMRGGDVGPAYISPAASNPADAARLWQICEQLTGLHYPA